MLNPKRTVFALTITALAAAFAGAAGAAQLPVQKPTREAPAPRPKPAPCKTHEVWVVRTVCTPAHDGHPICRRVGRLEKVCN